MAFCDCGRARLRPSRFAAWLAGRLALPNRGRARLRPSRFAAWLAGRLALPDRGRARLRPSRFAAWLAGRLALPDRGRARLRPSRFAAWLAGRLALPNSCKLIQEFLPHVVSQPVGEQDAGAGEYRFESCFLSAGEGRLGHSFLEEFGGIAEPGLVDVGDRHIDGLDIGGLGDGGDGVQDGGVGLPAALGICLHHVGQGCSGQGSRRDRRERGEVPDRRGHRRVIQPCPDPLPTDPMLIFQVDQRLACGGLGRRGQVQELLPKGRFLGFVVLGPGFLGLELESLGGRLRLPEQCLQTWIPGRGDRVPLPRRLPDRLRLGPQLLGADEFTIASGIEAVVGEASTAQGLPAASLPSSPSLLGMRQPGEKVVHQVVAHERVEEVAVQFPGGGPGLQVIDGGVGQFLDGAAQGCGGGLVLG